MNCNTLLEDSWQRGPSHHFHRWSEDGVKSAQWAHWAPSRLWSHTAHLESPVDPATVRLVLALFPLPEGNWEWRVSAFPSVQFLKSPPSSREKRETHYPSHPHWENPMGSRLCNNDFFKQLLLSPKPILQAFLDMAQLCTLGYIITESKPHRGKMLLGLESRGRQQNLTGHSGKLWGMWCGSDTPQHSLDDIQYTCWTISTRDNARAKPGVHIFDKQKFPHYLFQGFSKCFIEKLTSRTRSPKQSSPQAPCNRHSPHHEEELSFWEMTHAATVAKRWLTVQREALMDILRGFQVP